MEGKKFIVEGKGGSLKKELDLDHGIVEGKGGQFK